MNSLNQGEIGRLTPICVHIDRKGYWTSQSQIGVHLAGFIKVSRLVLNVLIFVTNFIIEGNLFQACYATEKKVFARCLSLMAGNSYSSPILLVCGLLAILAMPSLMRLLVFFLCIL